MWDTSLEEAKKRREEAVKNNPPAEQPKQENKPAEQPTETPSVENTEKPAQPTETPQAQTEEVKAETDDSSLNNDKPSEEQKPQEVNIEDLLKQKLEEGEYIPKSKYEEDLSSRMEVKSDFIKRLVELQNEGVEINEGFLTNYFENLDRYDVKRPSDLKDVLVREKMSDGYTKEDAELVVLSEYEDLFSGDTDADSTEFKVQRIKAETQARKFIEKLKQEKEKLAIPKEFGGNDVVEKYKQEQEKLSKENLDKVNKYLNEVSKKVDTQLKEVEVDISGTKVKYEVPSETKEKVKQAVKDYSTFLDKNFVTENGLNEQALFEFFTFYFDRDKILGTVSGQFKSLGKEETVEKDFKNSNFKPKEVPQGKQNNKNNLDKIPVSLRSFIGNN